MSEPKYYDGAWAEETNGKIVYSWWQWTEDEGWERKSGGSLPEAVIKLMGGIANENV